MNIYFESLVFLIYFADSKEGELVRKIFDKAQAGKVKIVTSAWSVNRYTEELTILALEGNTPIIFNRVLLIKLKRLEEELAKRECFRVVDISTPLLRSCIPLIEDDNLTTEQALHVFAAKIGDCDTIVIADEGFHLIKNRWKNDFNIYHLSDGNDVKKLEAILEQL